MTKVNAQVKLLQSIAKNAEVHIQGGKKADPKDPGMPPIFLFMPSKVQIMQMIVKALYDEAMPL